MVQSGRDVRTGQFIVRMCVALSVPILNRADGSRREKQQDLLPSSVTSTQLHPVWSLAHITQSVSQSSPHDFIQSLLYSQGLYTYTHTRTDISHIHTHTQKDISHIHTNRHLTHTHTNRNLTHTQTDISHTHTHTDISHTFTLSKLISTVGLTVKPDRLTRGLGGEGYR